MGRTWCILLRAMSRPTLLILAGCSAAGKSTLLKAALELQLPIFGEAADPLFQTLSVPSRFPESLLSFEQTLAERTWFQAIHLNALDALPELPEVVVLHVDLLNVLALLCRDPSYFGLTADVAPGVTPPGLDWLEERERVAALYRGFLSLPVFARFGHVVVNTLEIPWEENHRRLHVRDQLRRRSAEPSAIRRSVQSARRLIGRVCGRRPSPSLLEQLFDTRARRQDLHANLYSGWLDAIGCLQPQPSIRSRSLEGGRVAMTFAHMSDAIPRGAPARTMVVRLEEGV